MARDYDRYAVYWAPPEGSALAEAGATWLGWDAHARAKRPHPRPEIAKATSAARRYGFHGTLKPPFRLAEGRTAAALGRALDGLGSRTAAFPLPPLEVTDRLGFLAISCDGPCPPLDGLAGACVRDLDDFRAPLSEAEHARRKPDLLDAEERANLDRWGYPHVLGRFRFHLTLSGRCPPTGMAALARTHFGAALATPVRVETVSLFGDPGEGQPFHHLSSHALSG